ncbi:MAG: S8 family peptidase [Clostridiales bacterium]|nr:S8 family peptidase [Clostridiales bacterium]
MNTQNHDFFFDPDYVDFIARSSRIYQDFQRLVPDVFVVPSIYERFFLGFVRRQDVEDLIQNIGGLVDIEPVVLGLTDRGDLESAGIISVQEQTFLNLRGTNTLVGIVDTGIDYTNPAFIREDGTSKIQYILDQTERGDQEASFIFGREYSNEQINEALRSPNPYEIVPHRDNVGHGTFLASVAAGRPQDDRVGAAPDADLIVVKLRKARPYYLEKYLIPPDQENAYESSSVMMGLEYILRRAQELRRPVSICLGLGTNFGTHDGFSIFEEYLTSLSNLSGVSLVVAAGNESQARHHTQGFLEREGDTQNIDIRVGENAGDIFVSIVNGGSDKLSLSIRSPAGEAVGRVPSKTETVYLSRLVLERATVIVEYYFPLDGSGGQLSIVKLLNATPGLWTITVYGDIVLDGTYHAWLPITGFVSPNVEFTSPTPNYTIVVPGTAVGVITVGAYNSANNSLYSDTSWGPSRLPAILPDFTAPGVDVTGEFPTGPGDMSGTSVAAAITAGAAALMLQWGIVEGNEPLISTYQIKAYMIRGCNRDVTINYPNTQWGYGRLNLIQTFVLMSTIG